MRRASYYVVGIILVFMGWRHHHRQQLAAVEAGDPAPAPVIDTTAIPVERTDSVQREYRCDGRQYCSQMKDCAEATWFINHCPGTRMDGDQDGIPCETQHCAR